MKRHLPLGLLFILFSQIACHKDLDDVIRPASTNEIKNFIWRGMNEYYLYKEEIPALSDDQFSSQKELNKFLESYSSPEILFYDGLVAPQDEFSFLVDDYVVLEKNLDGIHATNGMQYGLVNYPEGSSDVFGYVRYVLPGTSAEEKGIRRGHLFSTVNQVQLTVENYARLLEPSTYTIGLAQWQNNSIIATGDQVELHKETHTTNPVHLSKTIDLPSGKVGYLMYNGFTSTFDAVLNEAFGNFKTEGIEDLVIDLRYNGGGSVETATDLASMITGQFQGKIFYTEQWNQELQTYFENQDPEMLINRFNSEIRGGQAINSLRLNRVYIITTLRTASASELLINGLEPYIQVIQIGERTTGKFQASTTLYDSPDFRRRQASTGHTYAIQPLIYKTINAVGRTDYFEGLSPDVEIVENVTDLGILGDPDEPLLRAALQEIGGASKQQQNTKGPAFNKVGESGMNDLFYKRMFSRTEILPHFFNQPAHQ